MDAVFEIDLLIGWLPFKQGTGCKLAPTRGGKQLINAPGEKKWVKVGTKVDFLAQGINIGFETIWQTSFPGINLRIIFEDNTRWIFP